jgi:hypothetical protein
MLGFSVGVGGITALGFGAIADILGLGAAFYIVTAFALVGGFLALILPKNIANVTYLS